VTPYDRKRRGPLGVDLRIGGDTVNVAARVEQLTKTTGNAILLTRQMVNALVSRPPGLSERGAHGLKGKSDVVEVFGLTPAAI
jgi:adenylate cyclase